jgi:hypothetical protein
MIINTVNQNDFHDAFMAIRPNNFSYDGLNALYEYFYDYSNANGEPIELDVIAICCEFSEVTAEELINDYSYMVDNISGFIDLDKLKEHIECNYTPLLEFKKDHFILQQF